MKVLICGGRVFNNWELFRDKLEEIANERFPIMEPNEYGNFLYDVTIISGGARGVDTLAANWAAVNWAGYKEYPADWERDGKKAGILRNIRMLEEGQPDLVIAFPGGRGTAHMVKIARKAGVEIIEVRIEATDD